MVYGRLLPWFHTDSKEYLLPKHLSYDKCQSVIGCLKSGATITRVGRKSGTWPTFPCSASFETNAKVFVSCVNWIKCGNFEEERKWQGRIVGNGIHGSLNTLLIKYKNRASRTDTPLMWLLTFCVKCRGEAESCAAEQLDQTVNGASGYLLLRLSEGEIEELLSSKELVMEGILMDSINSTDEDGQKKEWPMLRPLFNVWLNRCI